MTRRDHTKLCCGSVMRQVRASTPGARGRIRRRTIDCAHPSPRACGAAGWVGRAGSSLFPVQMLSTFIDDLICYGRRLAHVTGSVAITGSDLPHMQDGSGGKTIVKKATPSGSKYRVPAAPTTGPLKSPALRG